ncbi:MAG: hypothetical protein IKI38_02295 [Mogibacterium sp.]|nr:hypothetical protein [Mogibacterium sp.]
MKKLRNKKGSAWPVILVLVLLAALFIGYRVMKLHWQEFKARAGFATTLIIVAVVIILILILYIRYRIRKAAKEKEKRELEALSDNGDK